MQLLLRKEGIVYKKTITVTSLNEKLMHQNDTDQKNCKIWMTSVLGKKETPIHVMRLRFCLNLVYTRKQ